MQSEPDHAEHLTRAARMATELLPQGTEFEQEVVYIVLAMAPDLPDRITPDSRFVEDLAYDSLRLIELTVALEERFGEVVNAESGYAIRTLGDIAQRIREASVPGGTDSSWVR